jgi:hypothetical protein
MLMLMLMLNALMPIIILIPRGQRTIDSQVLGTQPFATGLNLSCKPFSSLVGPPDAD